MRHLVLAAAVTLSIGCVSDFPPPPAESNDAMVDGARSIDGGWHDDSALHDAAHVGLDAQRDAAPADADVDATHGDAATDAAPGDAHIPDAELDADLLDAEVPDAEVPDAEVPDAEVPDAEVPDADLLDAEVPDAEVEECIWSVEVCDGQDNDCNGVVDDVVTLGTACSEGDGVCRREGVFTCGDHGVICNNPPLGVAGPRICGDVDNDCDGAIDVPDQVDRPCGFGVGNCRSQGVYICSSAPAPICDADDPLDNAEPEACDGLDDDCNGIVDDVPGAGAACSVGVGACVIHDGGQLMCDLETGDLSCQGEPGAPGVERCNNTDDDCDGEPDNVDGLGDACISGIGACARPGAWVCNPAESDEHVCDATPGEVGDEICNGIDDDCDGQVDEDGACGGFIASKCRVTLGWADSHAAGPDAPQDSWGQCRADDRDTLGDVRCVQNKGDQKFRSFRLSGDVNDDDWLSVSFNCGQSHEWGTWIQNHCAVVIAHADNSNGEALDALVPEDCPEHHTDQASQVRCVSSNYDGRFHAMNLRGVVDDNDSLGVAFVCQAPDQDRADSVAASAEVFLAHEFRDYIVVDGGLCDSGDDHNVSTWGNCPDSPLDNSGHHRCASTAGDQRFHHFDFDHDVRHCDVLGVMIRSR